MDIAELARRSGVAASALRYYEKRGLIASVGRSGLRRTFDDGVLERLALIALGQSAGLSLDEIATMFAPDGKPRVDRALLARKADEIDARVAELVKIRNGLRHAAACRAADHMECPTFRRLLGTASARRARPSAPR
jgi:DNA-binding transcriptional MerR regulator